ncbi:MAG TPA: tetratricopeptide repeat protein [Anaerolineae bacterium]|nr:tetratricopeptide repeat protein [Anaerolineae bacterium]
MAQKLLYETLSEFIDRSGYTIGQVARMSGVPRRSLANWTTGRAKRPRNVQDLLRVAQVIRLTAEEVDLLLQSAEMNTTLSHLLRENSKNTPIYALLQPWRKTNSEPQSPPPAPQRNVPFQAIRDLSYFVGREDTLQILADRLRQPQGNLCVIQGMGGVGKSSIAARLAYQLRDDFPDGVLWARVDQSNTMAILHSFAAAFGRDVSNYSDVQTRSRVVREILADKRVLLILDGARDDEEIEPLLPPTTQRCGLIVTTRRIDLSSLLGAFWYRLTPFSDESQDSLNLFAKILGAGRVLAERTALSQLADLLGHLPLAIAITAGRLATDTLISAEDLLEQLSCQDTHTSELTYGRDSLRRSFDLSYTWLSPEEQHFFATLGIFANDEIIINAIAYVTDTDTARTNEILHKLYQLSLVQSAGIGRFKLHPLIHDYANTCRIEGIGSRERMVEFMVRYCEKKQYAYLQLSVIFNQLLAALDYAEKYQLDDKMIRGVHAIFPYLNITGQFDLAQQYLQRVYTLSLLHMDTQNQAQALASLGEIQRKRGRLKESGRTLGKALSLITTLPKSKLHATVYRHLGRQQMLIGEIEAAHQFLHNGIEIAQALEDHENACLILSRLAELERNRGNYDQSDAYESQGLQLAQKLGAKRLISASFNGCGITAIMRGNYEKGDLYFRESLKIAQEIGDREKSCGYLMNLATLSTNRGLLQQAQEMFSQALVIAREIGHRELQATLLLNIGVVCWRLGQLDQSAESLEEGFTVATVMQYAQIKLSASRRLGDLNISLGHYHKAERVLTESLTMARKLGYSAELTRLLCTLSHLYLVKNALDEATIFAQDGLRHARELGLPVEQCLLITTLAKIALIKKAYEECAQLLAQSSEITQAIDDPALLCDLNLTKAELALTAKNNNQAQQHYQAAYQLAKEQSLYEYHALALFGLARVLVAQNKLQEGTAFGRKSLLMFEESGYAAATKVQTWLYSNDNSLFVTSRHTNIPSLPLR